MEKELLGGVTASTEQLKELRRKIREAKEEGKDWDLCDGLWRGLEALEEEAHGVIEDIREGSRIREGTRVKNMRSGKQNEGESTSKFRGKRRQEEEGEGEADDAADAADETGSAPEQGGEKGGTSTAEEAPQLLGANARDGAANAGEVEDAADAADETGSALVRS